MPKHKVYQDSVSVFIKINGSIHRPLPSKLRFRPELDGEHVMKGPQWINNKYTVVTGKTKFKKDDVVIAKNINFTPYSNVEGELWVSHGSYYKKKSSEDCYHCGQLYTIDMEKM